MITFDCREQVVLVTGAARGLGFAIAAAFHTAGATVIVNDRTTDAVERAIARLGGGDRLIAAAADLAAATGPRVALGPALRLGRLDILVNNAAVNVEKSIGETDDGHWDQHLAVCLRAGFFTVKHGLPLLKASQGAVINIASELGLHAIPNNVAYVTAKHGLIAMTRAMAMELAPFKVRVNAVCPGTMDTELMRDCAVASGDPESYYAAFKRYHPLARIASPKEIASFVLCLASSAGAFMTGAAIAIDGGSTAGRM